MPIPLALEDFDDDDFDDDDFEDEDLAFAGAFAEAFFARGAAGLLVTGGEVDGLVVTGPFGKVGPTAATGPAVVSTPVPRTPTPTANTAAR
jgi:hypothetical protein